MSFYNSDPIKAEDMSSKVIKVGLGDVQRNWENDNEGVYVDDSFCGRFKENASNYATSSSLHGVQYIVEKGRTLLER